MKPTPALRPPLGRRGPVVPPRPAGYKGGMAEAKRNLSPTEWAVLGLALACLAGLVLPALRPIPGEQSGWQRSKANLREIGRALLHYHEVYGRLPPAVVTDRGGKPLYS